MSRKKIDKKGEIKMTKYEEVFSVEGKTLEDCTMEELIAIAYEEKIAAPAEVTKEELAELIRANHTGETGETPEVKENEGNEETKDNESEEPEVKENEGNEEVPEVKENEETKDDESEEDEEVKEKTIIKTAGYVNAAKLNVREDASRDADILTVISKGTGVGIDLTKSTEDFYCVNVMVDGELTAGFCVKEFITTK